MDALGLAYLHLSEATGRQFLEECAIAQSNCHDFDLDRIGWDWTGLDWIGLPWIRLEEIRFIRLDWIGLDLF